MSDLKRWPEIFLPFAIGAETPEEYAARAEAARVRGDFGPEWQRDGFPDAVDTEGMARRKVKRDGR